MRRRGFTIYEVLIALAISSILTIVLFNVLIAARTQDQKLNETLQYLRDASLLMEYIKTDIRNVPRGDHAIEGSSPSLMRAVPGTNTVENIQYQYDQEAGTVTRTALGSRGGSKVFGKSPGASRGYIVQFEVQKVDVNGQEPFYKVILGFASAKRQQMEADGTLDPTNRSQNHLVQALVSRRTPAGSDDKWNSEPSFQM